MSIPAAWPQCVDFFSTPLVIGPSPGQFSSDAKPLPITIPLDQRIGLAQAFTDALDDLRDEIRQRGCPRAKLYCLNFYRWARILGFPPAIKKEDSRPDALTRVVRVFKARSTSFSGEIRTGG